MLNVSGAALKKGGVTEEELLRVEGAMAYVMPHRIVASVLSKVSSVNLAERFTGFELRGEWVLHAVNEGIVIVPSDGIAIRENTGCPLKDSAPDLTISPGECVKVDDTQYSWPITWNPQSSNTQRARDDIDGFAALYGPKPIWFSLDTGHEWVNELCAVERGNVLTEL
jgi:hypothetical protein